MKSNVIIDKGKISNNKFKTVKKKKKKFCIHSKIAKSIEILLISLFLLYIKIALIDYCKNLKKEPKDSLQENNKEKEKENTKNYKDIESNHIIQIFNDFQKDIELKNEEYEKSNLNVEIVLNQINKINLLGHSNKVVIEQDILKSSNKDLNISEISIFLDNYRSIPLNENDIKNYNICESPNISIIIPTYNSQDELIYLHKSIQDQSLKNIEIIYVDNNSTDDTINIIQKIQKRDKRIILLKNKENKGPFYSRNKGVIFSKGEYIQFIDSDDILFGNNTLEKAYQVAKAFDLDVVQYKLIAKFKKKYGFLIEKLKNTIVYQPELSDLMYYGTGKLEKTNHFIMNKIIKKETFLKSLIFIGNEILNENLFFNEDILQLFSILRVANSFLYINDIGYAKLDRIKKTKTLFGSRYNPKFSNKILHDNFIEIGFIYNKTKNNKQDKAICCEFLKMTKGCYSSIFNKVTQGFELLDEIFTLLLNSEYINKSNKVKIKMIKREIMANSNIKKNKCNRKKFNF